jgi:PAS domain-containing protein
MLEQVFDATSNAVFSRDREWRFTFLNRMAQELLKQTPTLMIGKNTWENFCPSRARRRRESKI